MNAMNQCVLCWPREPGLDTYIRWEASKFVGRYYTNHSFPTTRHHTISFGLIRNKMILTQLMAIPLWGLCVSAYLVSPPGTAFPGADSDCSAWIEATSGMTCADIEATAGITEAQFEDWVCPILIASTQITPFQAQIYSLVYLLRYALCRTPRS
jgi:hypothetical protein